MHPESHPLQLYGPSNIEEGEKLLYKIYTAVRNSPDWNKILLIVLFDEHGGCYDHVCHPPPRRQIMWSFPKASQAEADSTLTVWECGCPQLSFHRLRLRKQS